MYVGTFWAQVDGLAVNNTLCHISQTTRGGHELLSNEIEVLDIARSHKKCYMFLQQGSQSNHVPKSPMTILRWDLGLRKHYSSHPKMSQTIGGEKEESNLFEIAVDDVFDSLSCKNFASDITKLGQKGAASAWFRSRVLD